MQILTGLFDRCVLQRDAKSKSNATIMGTSDASGQVLAVVKTVSKKSPGKAQKIGKASGGNFKALLKGLPAGGPYDIQLSIVDSKGKSLENVTVKNVLVGDVWIAGGQSNMEGCGKLDEHAAKPHPMVRAFYMTDHWDVAKDPIHQLEVAIDPVHNNGKPLAAPNPDRIRGVGASVDFAQEMHRITGVPQGVIACAHGGTSMAQWDPALRDKGGLSLYGATIRRLRKNGGRCAGVIWYQGESDSNPEVTPLFTQRNIDLIKAFRRDSGDKNLRFVAVQLSHFANFGDSQAWDSIKEQQRLLIEKVRNYSFVPAIDLLLDDPIHVGSRSMKLLGKRLAYAMDVLARGPKAGKPPIAIKKVTKKVIQPGYVKALEIEFENVVGSLRSIGRPNGFTVNNDGVSVPVYDVEVSGNRATIKFGWNDAADIERGRLYFGQGFDPYCNIFDEANRSVPAFGPVFFGKQRATTPFVQFARVSAIMPGAGKLEALQYPENIESLKLTAQAFPAQFLNRHLELEKVGPEDGVVYYAVSFEVTKAMKLSLNLGYDGPVKMWLDGNEIYRDPAGTNPARPDIGMVQFDATPGRHEVLVALGANCGQAWGIYLRLERLGLKTPKAIAEALANSEMPRFIG